MKKTQSIQKMTTAALLIALGIVIPMFSPFKIVIEPASFTLASHVAIFMAMFISPLTAIVVTIGTTIGFFLGGFPLPIVLRAASHIVFVVLGSYFLYRFPEITASATKRRIYSFVIGAIHALAEVGVVSVFYFGNQMTDSYYQGGFIYSVLLLVGIGGLLHSMLDFEIAWVLTRAICQKREIASLFTNIRLPKKTATELG